MAEIDEATGVPLALLDPAARASIRDDEEEEPLSPQTAVPALEDGGGFALGDAPEGGVSLPPGAIADHSAFDLPSSQSLERSSKLSRDNGMLEVTRELDVSRKDSAEDETRARTRSEEELEARNNLPEGWAVQVGEKGDQWYYNELTQDVSFQVPEATTQVAVQAELFDCTALPEGWEERDLDTHEPVDASMGALKE